MKIRFKQWNRKQLPKKVLFIRLQAMGDTVITLPYIKGFSKAYPEVSLHFLTRKEVSGIPKHIGLFEKIWEIRGGRNGKLQLVSLITFLPFIVAEQYDIIYDLQNNRLSRITSFFSKPKAWTAFDKFSPYPAGDRTYATIKAVGLSDFSPLFERNKSKMVKIKNLLKTNVISKNIFVINPAGVFQSRNWPDSYYHQWAELLISHFKGDITFLFLGIDRILKSARLFEDKFPKRTLNLVNQTTSEEAFFILQNAVFMLSEDSGLMHMSWISGIPTLAIFGSTRSDWSRPLGDHSNLLSSSDLDCGGCLLVKCKFDDNRCLTRYTPQLVYEETLKLLKNS